MNLWIQKNLLDLKFKKNIVKIIHKTKYFLSFKNLA